VWVKVYAQGGENYLHTHEHEDHVFVILDGQATFHDSGGGTTVLNKHQGMLLQRGAYYSFTSTGDTPLVLLRVGSADALPRVRDSRKWWPGEVDDRAERGVRPVEIPGQYFAPTPTASGSPPPPEPIQNIRRTL
jgi:hypothetical protein